ncbi:hypothetical protein RD792_007604 [Penstemon davidsonii]|uniref:Uncharacterized protein n=1 Tax=Penstemon davidsonii TaxID=160366 RepID=A0ABR0D6Z7_9LAMI|nr:hypothetical protein RD792_007604 [Penstemon davidsonii]
MKYLVPNIAFVTGVLLATAIAPATLAAKKSAPHVPRTASSYTKVHHSPLPNGIPTYTVEIENVCVSGSCIISDIHLSCEWFSSARVIDPKIFRRVRYNDCLVNDGQPLNPGESLSFQYANTFKYPLSVSSVAC